MCRCKQLFFPRAKETVCELPVLEQRIKQNCDSKQFLRKKKNTLPKDDLWRKHFRKTLEKMSVLQQLTFKSRSYSIRHILPTLLHYLHISLSVVPYVPAKRTEIILILFWKSPVMSSEKLHTQTHTHTCVHSRQRWWFMNTAPITQNNA
jgi:hypothetical protein